jgi:hypothetical protein
MKTTLEKAIQPMLEHLAISTYELAEYIQTDKSNFVKSLAGRRTINLEYLISLAELDVQVQKAVRQTQVATPPTENTPPPDDLLEQQVKIAKEIEDLTALLAAEREQTQKLTQRIALLRAIREGNPEMHELETFWMDERIRAAEKAQSLSDTTRPFTLRMHIAGLQAQLAWLKEEISKQTKNS